MSTEVENQGNEEEQVVAPDAEQTEAPVAQAEASTDDADFQAGFDSANGIETPEPEPAPEPVRFAGYTEEELKKKLEKIEALEQRESKVFGSLGSLKQSIESLKNAPQAQPQLAMTPDKFKRLSSEFPEIAALLADDLSEMSVSAPPVQLEEQIKTSVDQTAKAFEQKLLTVQHRDWKQVVQSQEFVGWKETLPPEVKAELDASWDAEFIGEKLSEFKEWKAKAVQSKQTNKQRLESSITPRGSSGVKLHQSESDAFAAGFKSVRG